MDTQTAGTGDFTFPSVLPDTYTVRVTVDGFKTLERRNIAVSPGDRVVVGTMTIELGALSETVTVTGEAPLIQAQSGERSSTVTTEAVQNLPIANRNFGGLASLTPGVIGTTRIGTPGSTTNFQIDGVSTIDTGAGGQALQLNVEAIAEVRVIASGYQAEFGRNIGLQITGVTKSGTNQYRGSIYDIQRNSDWNSNSWVNAAQRRSQSGLEAAGLGLYHRRADRETGRRQPVVLLLRPRISSAQERRQHQSLPRADAARAAGRLLADDRQQRHSVPVHQGSAARPG